MRVQKSTLRKGALASKKLLPTVLPSCRYSAFLAPQPGRPLVPAILLYCRLQALCL